MKRRTLAGILSALLLVSLWGCGKEEAPAQISEQMTALLESQIEAHGQFCTDHFDAGIDQTELLGATLEKVAFEEGNCRIEAYKIQYRLHVSNEKNRLSQLKAVTEELQPEPGTLAGVVALSKYPADEEGWINIVPEDGTDSVYLFVEIIESENQTGEVDQGGESGQTGDTGRGKASDRAGEPEAEDAGKIDDAAEENITIYSRVRAATGARIEAVGGFEQFADKAFQLEFHADDWEPADEYSFILQSTDMVSLGDTEWEVPLPFGFGERVPDGYTTLVYDNFNLRAKDYGVGEKQTSAVFFMRADSDSAATFRGICVGHSLEKLKSLYPDDLFHFQGPLREKEGNETEYEAYVYLPDDGGNRYIEFLIKEGAVAEIVMEDGIDSRKYERPKEGVRETKREFVVSTYLDYYLDIPTALEDSQQDTQEDTQENIQGVERSFHFVIPKVETPNAQSISDRIDYAWYDARAKELNQGNYAWLKAGNYKYWDTSYEVHRYANAAALTIHEEYGIVDAGGGHSTTSFFYDCDRGRPMSAKEYAVKCGYDPEEIVKAFNKEYGHPMGIPVFSVYCVPFFIDENGELNLFYSFST